MNKNHIIALSNFLMYYSSDLEYIRNFQRFLMNKISINDYCKKVEGSFYSFLIEYKIIRNFEQGKTHKVLELTKQWVNSNNPDDVDAFAELLKNSGYFRGNLPISLASKILFLNNPAKILPIDNFVRKHSGIKVNEYKPYLVFITKFRKDKANRTLVRSLLSKVSKMTRIIEDEYKSIFSEAKLQLIRENRLIDKLFLFDTAYK